MQRQVRQQPGQLHIGQELPRNGRLVRLITKKIMPSGVPNPLLGLNIGVAFEAPLITSCRERP
jgi:hypothetical protein